MKQDSQRPPEIVVADAFTSLRAAKAASTPIIGLRQSTSEV